MQLERTAKNGRQPWKSSDQDSVTAKVSDLVTPRASVNFDQVNAVQCPIEDYQLNTAKEVQFVYWEHSAMHIKDTSCPALEDIVATGWESADSELPEAYCSDVNSSCSDLLGAVEIQSVPHDCGAKSFDACPSNSNMVGTGELRSNSGHRRFNSQIKSNRIGWSRNRMISNGFRKSWTNSREFRKDRRGQTYAGNSYMVNSSINPRKCFNNESVQCQFSASNSQQPFQNHRAKPAYQENSDFVWQRPEARTEKKKTHARRESYIENHSVPETRRLNFPNNRFSFSQQQSSSELLHAVQYIPYQSTDRYAYGVREEMNRSCGQEAAVSPKRSFDQGFGISGVLCSSVPVQSSTAGYLTWEGWMLGVYQPYSLNGSQNLVIPGWYSGSTINLSIAQHADSQCNYGREFFSSEIYHCGFMPDFSLQNLHGILKPAQLSYVPHDFHGAMVRAEHVMNEADPVSLPAVKGQWMPEESKYSDARSRMGAKSNKKTKAFAGCDATGRTAERETWHKIDSSCSSVTDSIRPYEAHKHSDAIKNHIENVFEEDQVGLSAHCTAPGDQSTYVCSQKTAEALATSWKSQVISESILEATGSPIAQFERLLYASAPVIAFSPYKIPDGSSCNIPRSSLLSKHWWPDVSLLDVWKWYIQCASFGIGAKVEDSWNSDSFIAYFSPTLSAIQLFRHTQNSLSDSLKKLSVDVAKTGNIEKCLGSPSSLDFKHAGEPSGSDISSSLHQNDSVKGLIDNSSAPSFCFSDDAELIFEHFEHDQPQHRKPLHQTIIEIKEQGSSNPHSFGDPSELDQLKLCDLHPASWYSVAWYPICRIPENNRSSVPPIRASFLTYHSLSQLAMRHENPDQLGNNSSCVVPALGLRKYNGKDECWFCPTKFPGPISIHGAMYDNSKVVEERLRALEEVAAIFSDGFIQRNGVATANEHSDFDFFIRRT